MRNELVFDFRFPNEAKKREYLLECCNAMTPDELKLVMKAAAKLEIQGFLVRPAVDVMYDIAERLSVLEAEVVSPASLIDTIKRYLESD